MKSFLFVLEVEPMKVGKSYNKLTLHCTVLHWFNVETSAEELLRLTSKIFSNTHPIELVAGEPAMFGPSSDPHSMYVNKVVHNQALVYLHRSLLKVVDGIHAQHTEPSYTGGGFNFHVTMQEGRSFVEGTKDLSTAAYLVERVEGAKNSRKFIRAKIPLT